MEQLMRCSKVAHAFDISVRTLKRRVKAGKFYPQPVQTVGGWFWKRSEVERVITLMSTEREARLQRAMRATPSLIKASVVETHAATTERISE